MHLIYMCALALASIRSRLIHSSRDVDTDHNWDVQMTSAWDHKEMLKECTFITLEKNKILFVQGDSIDSLFMVITGALRVMVKFDNYNKPKREEEEGASPKEMKKVPIVGKHDLGQQVALLDKGDTIGEMCLMLQEEQSASVVAAEECNILEITRQALLALKMRRPSVVTDLKIRAMKLRGQMVEESQKGPFAMRKTDVKTKTLNPVWEETFCFYNLDVSSSLVVSIFDHDIVGSHDFLGRVLLPIQSLPINQSLESWFPLQARSDDEEVSGSVCLHLRLQTDKRKRIECMDGETFVSEIDINGNTLNLMRDSSSNYADPRPATIFRLGSKIGAWHACPADPRNIAVGNHNGGVFLLRLQDYLNYRWEREALEEQAKQEQSLTTLPRSSLEPFLPAN
jgi:CRP-like cAMP-binding protein